MNLKFFNKTLCLILVVFTLTVKSNAQEFKIRGNITDTFSHTPLKNAVISLVSSQDSILRSYTYSNQNGNFVLPYAQSGKYILLISFPTYADFIDTISLVNGKRDYHVDTIFLNTKVHILEDVIVKQKISAIRIKGDTTEYKASYFKLDPNATVQDLLKVLPGIQVNSKGEITAKGEKVQKVLVDGDEFFSDDPAVVTQNLRADFVDAVQVYDKKSDQAVFTGIDDGETTKTINLKLKADKKLGYFGQIDLGSNFSNYYSMKGMVNFFNKTTKIAAYLTKDNTHYQALSFDEQNNFSTNLNMTTTINDNGTMSMQATTDEFGWGQGYPTSITGGVVYNKKWDQENQKLNNTYQYSHLYVDGSVIGDSKYILNNNVSYYTHQNEDIKTLKIRHLFNSVYDWSIGSNASLKAVVKGVFVNHNNSNTIESMSTSNNLLINNENRYSQSEGNNNNLNVSLLYQQKLKKKGRTISVAGDFVLGKQNANDYLKDNIVFYNTSQDSIGNQNINQFKPATITETKTEVRVNYTEPIVKKIYAELSYKLTATHNDALKQSFALSSSQQYNIFIDSLSNHLLYNTTSHTGDIAFKYSQPKFNFSLGTGLGVSHYFLNNIFSDSISTSNFFNVLPSAKLDIKGKKQSSLSISYNGLTRNPSLLQMQPIKDNSNPLNISIGNPALKQAFVNNVNISYNISKPNRNQFAYISANINSINNDFSNSSHTDSLGRTVNQAINVKNTYNLSLKSNYSLEITHGIRYIISFNPSFSNFSNFVNGVANVTRVKNIAFETGIQRYNGGNVSFNLNIKPSFNISESSIQADSVLRYWSFESNPDLDIRLPHKIYFTIGGDIHIYEKTTFAKYENIFWINSSIRKFFSKSDSWELRFSINDIFNDNALINRNINSNLVEQTTYSNIKRYFMISVAYHFNKSLK